MLAHGGPGCEALAEGRGLLLHVDPILGYIRDGVTATAGEHSFRASPCTLLWKGKTALCGNTIILKWIAELKF